MDNKNSQIDKWKRRSKRFGLIVISAIIAFVVFNLVATDWQSDQAATPLVGFTLTSLFVAIAVSMLGFVFSKLALFIAKLRAPKENSGNITKSEKARPVGWRAHKKLIFVVGVVLIPFILVLFDSTPETCKDMECFIAAAKDGKLANFQSTDKEGIEWSYQIKGGLGSDKTFTKTLLRLDDKELPRIKEFLEGKSLTCKLLDDFDERLVTSLVYGIDDNCSGELKENLGQLLFLL